MNTWFCKKYSNAIVASDPIKTIQNFVEAIYTIKKWPIDMAVFMNTNDETNEVILYFTPNLDKVARMFEVTPCDKPPREGLKLIVGDQKAIEYYFGK